MSYCSVPERVNDFLIWRMGRQYCDTCIQERLGPKWRQQVQLITATLAVTPMFRRELARCCTCNEEKQVACAGAASQLQALPIVRKSTVTGVGKINISRLPNPDDIVPAGLRCRVTFDMPELPEQPRVSEVGLNR
jgi:hypothetical protein